MKKEEDLNQKIKKDKKERAAKINARLKNSIHGKDTVLERSKKFKLEQKKKEKKTFKEKIKSVNKKVWYSIAAVIIIIMLVLTINLFVKANYFKKYKHYETKMDRYQFTQLYNNGKCKG